MPAVASWPLEGGNPQRNRYAGGDLIPPFTSGVEYVVGGDTTYVSPVSVGDGTLFVDAERKLHAIDQESGDELWHFNITGSFSSPAVADDQVFIRSEYGDDGYVYALGRDDGSLLWQFKFPRVGSSYNNIGGHVTSPVVAENLVLVGASRQLYAFDRVSGEIVWTFSAIDPIAASTSVTDDRAYVADFSRIYALDLASGEAEWQFEHDTVSLFFAPIVDEGAVTATGTDTVYHLDAGSGDVLWVRTFPDIQVIPAASAGDQVFVKSAFFLTALERESGDVLWQYDGDDFVSLPAVTDEQLYVVARGNGQGRLRAISRRDGSELWRSEVTGLANAAPAIAGDTVFVRTVDGRVLGFATTKE